MYRLVAVAALATAATLGVVITVLAMLDSDDGAETNSERTGVVLGTVRRCAVYVDRSELGGETREGSGPECDRLGVDRRSRWLEVTIETESGGTFTVEADYDADLTLGDSWPDAEMDRSDTISTPAAPPPPRPSATRPPPPPPPLVDAAFAICSSVGTADAPAELVNYTGPPRPFAVNDGGFTQQVVWRCWDGRTWGCIPGATAGQCMKVDTSTTPSGELTAYCLENPDSLPPNAATGHGTVYDWRCDGTEPTVVDRLIPSDRIDGLGYQIGPWFEIIPAPGTAPGWSIRR